MPWRIYFVSRVRSFIRVLQSLADRHKENVENGEEKAEHGAILELKIKLN
jgi:hypothetical protein